MTDKDRQGCGHNLHLFRGILISWRKQVEIAMFFFYVWYRSTVIYFRTPIYLRSKFLQLELLTWPPSKIVVIQDGRDLAMPSQTVMLMAQVSSTTTKTSRLNFLDLFCELLRIQNYIFGSVSDLRDYYGSDRYRFGTTLYPDLAIVSDPSGSGGGIHSPKKIS